MHRRSQNLDHKDSKAAKDLQDYVGANAEAAIMTV